MLLRKDLAAVSKAPLNNMKMQMRAPGTSSDQQLLLPPWEQSELVYLCPCSFRWCKLHGLQGAEKGKTHCYFQLLPLLVASL